MTTQFSKKPVSTILRNGGVGVLLSDTIYGIVGQALNETAVERIYRIKHRNHHKPFIILISSVDDLALFGVYLHREERAFVETVWPGPVSVILSCPGKKWAYLHRGTETLAFRMPNKPTLLTLLRSTGPLVAPSANPEHLPPARSLREARAYFGDLVDFYASGGRPHHKPSSIVKIHDKTVEYLRR